MGTRFIGALLMVSAIALAIGAGQYVLLAQQRATQPAAPAAPVAAAPQRSAQPPARLARIGGHPNFNGVWQALNSANWNLEAHSVSGISQAWQLGAIASIPAGKSMIKGGGTIPYKPEALKQRNENRAKWPESDNEAKCYMLGIPRYTYHNIPFQISQGRA